MSAERLAIAEAFLAMRMRPCDADAHDDPAMRDHIVYQILQFPSFALPSVEKPVVICGFGHVFGHCTAWMVTGEGFEKAARQVLSQQRALCRSMYEALPVHRMDIEVDASRKDAQKWARALGFGFECTKKRAGTGGQDLFIYLWPDVKGA